MTFSEKLDLLMSLTGTSNSALGRALSYDPSYISRVRAGKRGLPRRQPFLQPASEYFAQAIVSPIQKNAAANLMTAGQPWPDDPADAVPVIHRWLAFSPEDMSEPLDRFFQSLTAPPVTWGTLPQMETPPVLDRDPVFFFGSQGKREAVIRFLSDVCLADSARTLHLFSDEDMDWLFDDAAFSAQWSALLVRFLAAGGTIHIIHTSDRDLGRCWEPSSSGSPCTSPAAFVPTTAPGSETASAAGPSSWPRGGRLWCPTPLRTRLRAWPTSTPGTPGRWRPSSWNSPIISPCAAP